MRPNIPTRGATSLRRERGFGLIFMAVTIVILLGMLGLAFDFGRMFIVKAELQSYADAAAMASIYHMDGSQQGVQQANTIATSGPFGTHDPPGYYFDSRPVSTVTTAFATTVNGTYDAYTTASFTATNHYSFVKVTASATVPVLFVPAIQGVPTTMTLTASAVAGQHALSTVNYGGISPFMPDAHTVSDHVNFGFIPGGQYTLKWGNSSSNGNGKGKGSTSAGTTCTNDIGWDNPNPSSQHGFVDLGQGNGNSSLRDSIDYGGYPNANSSPSSLSTGMTLDGVPGNRGTSLFDAMLRRVDQDTDHTSATYSQYVSGESGNGRRIITVPVGDPATWSGNGNGSSQVVGFANFFLATTYSGSTGSLCAYYIGPASLNGGGSGASDSTKVYYNVLFQ
ncbi:MAG: pilus assembly protein TadG-related protein [Acidobacteriota bacterium]